MSASTGSGWRQTRQWPSSTGRAARDCMHRGQTTNSKGESWSMAVADRARRERSSCTWATTTLRASTRSAAADTSSSACCAARMAFWSSSRSSVSAAVCSSSSVRRLARIVTRGWLDVRNRDSAARPSPVVEGREYRLRWAMQPQDYVVEKGHRLGVVLISTDHDHTLRHPPGTRMTVRTGLSSVTLPVAPLAGS
ncbi:CocE/NonD family hydrolase C-terminal non-catalytic domain-containing protein [Streptomyces massasporeus]